MRDMCSTELGWSRALAPPLPGRDGGNATSSTGSAASGFAAPPLHPWLQTVAPTGAKPARKQNVSRSPPEAEASSFQRVRPEIREQKELIWAFAETYSPLTPRQRARLMERVGKRRKKPMKLPNMWIEAGMAKGISKGRDEGMAKGRVEGIAKGRVEGERVMLLHMLQRRLGPLPKALARYIEKLPDRQLPRLGEALFDFAGVADLRAWLSHARKTSNGKAGRAPVSP